MAEEPDLVISAGFSDAQLVAESNKVVAAFRKRGEEAQKAFQDAQGRVTNTQAARAHARDLDRLARQYDPVYRAAKKYEDEVRRLDRALDVGAISQQKYTAEVAKAARQMNQAGDVAQAGARKFRGAWQNIGFQVGDVATQVGAGTSMAQALGQQLPQLLGGFGTLGALMGAGAAIAIPLAAALARVASDSQTLEERMGALSKSTDAYVDAVENAATPLDELRQKYGDLADEIARVNEIQVLITGAAAGAALNKMTGQFASQFGGFGTGVDQAYTDMTQFEATIERVRKQFGLTRDDARKVAIAMQELSRAGDAQGIYDTGKALSELLISIAGDADKANEKFGEFLSGGDKKVGLFAILDKAKEQVGAADRAQREAQQALLDEYDATTQKLKDLAGKRETAEKMLAEAVKSADRERIASSERVIRQIDKEVEATRQLARESDQAYRNMVRGYQDYAASRMAGNAWANTAAGFEAEYVARRASGAGSEDEELVRAVAALAEQMGVAARDLLAVMSFETGGKLRPDVIGLTTGQGQHFGLIQFGDKGAGPRYGVTPDSSITDQVIATGKYLQDAGVKAGDSLANIYAAVLASDARKVNASDLAAGGVVGNVTEATGGDQFAPHIARAEGMLAAYGGLVAQAKKDQTETTQGLKDEVRERERLARQAKEYGEQLSRNLLSEQQQAELAKSQADQIAAIKASGMSEEDQSRAIAAVTAEVERQRVVFSLLEEAKRRHVDLDAMLADGSMTYKQAIEALGDAKKADIIATQERAIAEGKAAEAQQLMADVQQQVRQGLLDSILAGESFADVLANVGKMFASAALEAALFNTGAWSTAGGGKGLVGGLLSAIGFSVGGYTGPGGRNEPAGIVHKGEVVWSQDDVRRAGGVGVVEAMRRGTRLPGLADGGVAMPSFQLPAIPTGSGSRAGNSINASFAPNISIAPGVTQAELAMTMVAARQEFERNFLPMLRKTMPQYQERFG